MKLEEQEIQKYAEWVLTDCCSPLDEIEYLVGMLMTSDKSIRIAEEIKEVLAK
tara:strand:+ start:987 stop:1145 length:159 start_codon:yes stop_codon:yes gene_type:complete